MIKPHGTLLVAGTHGRRVAAARFALDSFVPRTSIPYPVLVRGKEIPAGTYRASIDVWAAAGRHVHATVPLVVADDDTIATYGSPKPHFGSPPAAATPRSHPVAPAPRLRDDGGDTHRFPLPALLVILLLAALASAPLLLRRRLRPVALAAAAAAPAPPAPAPAPPPAPAPAAKPK